MATTLRVSAIVPTLNEEQHIEACLECLQTAAVDEIVVVDGGSSDATCSRARRLADRVFETPEGLFTQLNFGAEQAAGDVLLFHYADGLLPEGSAEAIRQALIDPRVVGGAFRLGYSSPALVYRFIAWGANLRNRICFGPFADQSIFVRAADFRRLGGFDPRVLFPDPQLVKGLKHLGKFRLLEKRVRASARRWETQGLMRTALNHWGLSGYYLLGGRKPHPALRERLGRLRKVR